MLSNRYLQLFISLFFWVFQEIRYVLRRLLGNSSGILVTLCYHEITEKQAPYFMKQMRWLKRLSTPVFADVEVSLRRGYFAAVTFDDGFQNLLTNALPFLEKEQIPSTLFIPTACLGQMPVWLKNTPHPTAQEMIITSEQLRVLSKAWIKIGSHSHHHADLKTLSFEMLQDELQVSKQILEELMQYKITLLAFPYGRFNDSVIEVSKLVGYERIFAADPLLETNSFLFERLDVYPEMPLFEFVLKIRGAYHWLPWASHQIESLKNIFKN